MDDLQIKILLEQALNILSQKDSWLLRNNLSEQSISHKLAEYIQKLFPDYDVDCEYNGDIESPNDRKRIYVLRDDLKEIGLLKNEDENELEKEYTIRAVFPDIIIHKRGSNKNNLCIIEIKKSTSNVPVEYDYLKLRCYTSSDFDNNLKYQLGVFIKAIAGEEHQQYILTYFKNGLEIK